LFFQFSFNSCSKFTHNLKKLIDFSHDLGLNVK
jgi:hypothetical protein